MDFVQKTFCSSVVERQSQPIDTMAGRNDDAMDIDHGDGLSGESTDTIVDHSFI